MNIAVRTSDLTLEQEQQVARCYKAAELLNQNGFRASVFECVTTKPTDRAAYISIE